LQILLASLIITSFLGLRARFRSSSACPEFKFFPSIVFGSFIQRSGMEKPFQDRGGKGKLGVSCFRALAL